MNEFEKEANEIYRVIWARCLDKDPNGADKDVDLVKKALRSAYSAGMGKAISILKKEKKFQREQFSHKEVAILNVVISRSQILLEEDGRDEARS